MRIISSTQRDILLSNAPRWIDTWRTSAKHCPTDSIGSERDVDGKAVGQRLGRHGNGRQTAHLIIRTMASNDMRMTIYAARGQ